MSNQHLENLVEIHQNNSDLSLDDLARIADVSRQEAYDVLQAHYSTRGRGAPAHVGEPIESVCEAALQQSVEALGLDYGTATGAEVVAAIRKQS